MEHNRDFKRWDAMQKIFISYSRKDIDFVRKFAGDLESAGYDVWWDITDLQGGDDWVRMIPNAIASSQYVIVVLTPYSIESEWVKKEYTQALSLRKKIIPIMLVPCNVPFALNTINFVNFAGGEYADNFRKLLPSLGYTGKPLVVAPHKKTVIPLPPIFLKYGIPALIGLTLVAIFAWINPFEPPAVPTITPTLATRVTASPTPHTLEPATPSDTATATRTLTLTPTVTWTVSPVQSLEVKLKICITTDASNIFVRSGPDKAIYAGTLLYLPYDPDEKVCPWFSARIWNEREGFFWLLVAPDQTGILEQYEGGWIRQDVLDKNISIDILPVVTLTATPTPSNTPTITPSSTPSFTPTITPSSTATNTFTPTPTDTSTPTSTATDIPTETPTP